MNSIKISTPDAQELGRRLKQLMELLKIKPYLKIDILQKTGWTESYLQIILEIALSAELIKENVREDTILYSLE
ncbi:hypothetical protein [Iningainema tapete]|uniref:Uncharacterized protein n=1 Tax=Iningainema tapete BLCC-T55 TaxID=2748662 RepID=A0A8J6XNW0_9CYAN|nr:hypothetical protein [Iningainema tapete]MBD2775405.1 hypothetical protein [Iningainema tapete BLCC-T55]